jgi:CARDB
LLKNETGETMKRFIAIAVGVAAALSLSTSMANAANPTADASVTIDPQGSLYKEVAKPVNISLTTNITPPAGGTTLLPLLVSDTLLPPQVEFVPDPNMPVCTAINAGNADFPPETARQQCPDSILGEGTSKLYLAQQVAAPITDPIQTIFNGGGGKIVIQAYSASTNHGIYLSGEIKNGHLTLAVPRLTADSAVYFSQLNIPGAIGQDKSFVQATCDTGSFTSSAAITLGKRDEAGTISNQLSLTSAPKTTSCTGLAGSAKFGNLKIKAPSKVKNGKKGSFKVTVTNKGTASSKKGTVKASGAGKGSASLPVIKPGAKKTVTVKAKVKGKKGKKVTVKFKASGGASASGKAKVKVG